VLEELPAREAALELLEREEVVVAPVLLAGPRRPGGGRDRQLELGQPLQQPADQRSLADARWSCYDEEAQKLSALAPEI
jgi:hypothetical protein